MEKHEIIQSYFLLNFVPFVHRNVNILNIMHSKNNTSICELRKWVDYLFEQTIDLSWLM
jgi:hypothetical protein